MPARSDRGRERRQHPRADIDLPVQLYSQSNGQLLASGRSVDLSPGGLLVECPKTDRLHPGDLVHVHVGLPGDAEADPSDRFAARVVRLAEAGATLCAVQVVGRTPPFLFAPELVGKHASIVRVKNELLKVADYDINVLIRGETGTGKNVLATLIHRYSRRSSFPCVRVNCPSIAPSLVESELFGHEKGAFTDARSARPGLFRLAGEGTILLDEISAIPPSIQAKLLQVIEEGRFIPVGGSSPVKTNARIVAITNEDVRALIGAGRFREDLYHRLNVASISLPALRERRSDIPLLVYYFLRRYAAEFGKPYAPLSDALMAQMQAYDWPGNVRELSNCIKYGVLTGEFRLPDTGLPEPFAARPATGEGARQPRTRGLTMKEVRERAVEEAERRAIMDALGANRYNKSRAARELGISYRTLLRKIHRYGIET